MQDHNDLAFEEWRDIEEYEGLYQVSNLGRVRGLPKKRGRQHCKILSHFVRSDGYVTTTLSKNGQLRTFGIHRLVASAFVSNPEGKPQVNHIDGDKANNAASNLEWVTRLENIRHSWETGLRDIDTTYAKKRRAVVRGDGEVFASITEAAKSSGASPQGISRVLKGSLKKTHGYTFRYLEETA